MGKTDPYERLKKATVEELFEAVIKSYQNAGFGETGFVAGIRYGFKLAQKDGWEHVAPIWLDALKKEEKHDQEKVA